MKSEEKSEEFICGGFEMKKIIMMLMMAVMAITANAQKYALIDMEYILKMCLPMSVPTNSSTR